MALYFFARIRIIDNYTLFHDITLSYNILSYKYNNKKKKAPKRYFNYLQNGINPMNLANFTCFATSL